MIKDNSGILKLVNTIVSHNSFDIRATLLNFWVLLVLIPNIVTAQNVSVKKFVDIISQERDSNSFEFHLKNTGSETSQLYLSIGENEVVDITIKNKSQILTTKKGWSQRRKYISDVTWKYQEVTLPPLVTIVVSGVVFSISGRPNDLDQIVILEEPSLSVVLALFEKARWGVLVAFIFLGTCLALLSYFIALSFTDRKPEHKYFAFFMIAISLNSFMIIDGGMDFNIIFKNPKHYLYLNDFFVSLTFISYTLFVFHFLEVKKHSRLLTNYIYLQISLHVFTLLVCTIWVYAYDDIVTIRGPFSILYIISFLLSVGSLIWIWKVIPTRLKYPIIVGSLLWSTTSLIELSMVRGYTLSDFIIEEWGIFSFTITQLGFFPIIIGFSLAIGYKNKLRDQEKFKISHELINQLEQNKQLQTKYTQELEHEVLIQSQEIVKEKERSLKSEYENKILQLESDQLISQMNPHFIFNSLNSIKYYALAKSTSETADYITDFAQLMRTILDHSRKKMISIQEECEFLLIYLSIEAKRFDNKFTFDIKCNELLKVYMIPPMLIQPLAENAIVHGKLHIRDGGHVSIIFEKTDHKTIVISIRDNGVGRAAAKDQKKNTKRTSHATQIMKDRIKVLNSSDNLNISIRTNDLHKDDRSNGTEVFIQIPRIKIDTLEGAL